MCLSKRRGLDIDERYGGIDAGIHLKEDHMAKVKIETSLYERAERAAEAAGYSSVDEFVAHSIENELNKLAEREAEARVSDQLRGLGYIE
jgi:hypothetical protein